MKPQFAALGALSALLLVSACGQETAPGRTASPSAPPPTPPSAWTSPSPSQRYEVRATVLENAKHGPQLCHVYLTSLPPMCGGPDIVGWDWGTVKSESQNGVKWGTYLLTGTWDGTRFTLTEPAKPDSTKGRADHLPKGPDFSPPCAPPTGGWRPVDPSKSAAPHYERALQLAEKDAEFAGGWVGGKSRTVLVMRFTRDLPGHEREIRKVWGGPLCLTSAKHSRAELQKVQDQVGKTVPNILTADSGSVENAVSVLVVLATEELQRDMDRRFGAGVVKVDGWLKPIG